MLFQYGMLVEGVTSTATAGGTTTLSATSSQIQNFTGSSSQTVKLPPTTSMSVGQFFEIYNSSTGALTMQYQDGTSFTSNSTVSPGSSLVVKLVSTGTTNGTWTIQTGSSASASGSKNYLSAYTASTSGGTPNTGNGNFELGSTSGWSLAHSALSGVLPTSTATAGSAFSSTSGGSSASGNLSLSVVSSGQLSGSYSGSLASSAASTAGDMMISNAFYIDLEDKAKVMTIKMYYTAASGASNLNFSGTSSNSFAVWVYDVTNGAWIMPAGVYNLVQNSGAGYVTGTFQTTSNSTEYQIALININASAGAYTMYFDDIFVGPQTAPSGPAMTDWQSYTPVFSNFGTCTAVAFAYKRSGDSIYIRGNFTVGSTSGSTATISLPNGWTINSSGVPSTGTMVVGAGAWNQGSPTRYYAALAQNGSSFLTMGLSDSVNNPSGGSLLSATGSTLAGSGQVLSLETGPIPIVGWSSNTAMSSDTATNVVAMRTAITASSTITNGGGAVIIPLNAATVDTNGGLSSNTYTVPVTGLYKLYASLNYNAAESGVQAVGYKQNGGSFQTLYSINSAAQYQSMSGVDIIKCSAGDTIAFYAENNAAGSATVNSGNVTIERLSGPAVVAATETVSAMYYAPSQSVPSGSVTTLTTWTKEQDDHNAFSNGVFTAPVTGTYLTTLVINWNANFTGSTISEAIITGPSFNKNASATNIPQYQAQSVTGQFKLLAGQTLSYQAFQNSGSSQSISGGQASAFMTVVRVGN